MFIGGHEADSLEGHLEKGAALRSRRRAFVEDECTVAL